MNWENEALPAIMAVLNSVEGMGRTHNSERAAFLVPEHEAFFYTDDGKFHVWWPALLGWADNDNSRQHQIFREYQIELTGLYAVKNADESRLIFEGIVLRVGQKFDNDGTYGLSGLFQFQTPTTAEILAEAVDYGGVLCHRAAVRFSLRESFISE